MRRRILPFLLFWFYRFWSMTWRIHIEESPELQELLKNKVPFIFALWHGDELALLRFASRYCVATMSSTSKDGELMDRVLHKFGFLTSRGSSTRGGARALIGLMRLVRAGRAAVVTVDGPKGPYHQPKPGVFELSRHLQCPIVPGGIACSSAIVFQKSWNKAYLPKPFSKVYLSWGRPLPAVSESRDARDEALAHSLREAIDAAGHDAARRIGKHQIPSPGLHI